MMNMKLVVPLLLLLAPTITLVSAVPKIRIVSPLQALTIWDPEEPSSALVVNGTVDDAHRRQFLPKFKAGLQAEANVRKEYAQKKETLTIPTSGAGWARQAQQAEQALAQQESKAAEAAFAKATKEFDKEQQKAQKKSAALVATSSSLSSSQNPNTYQFVGVISPRRHHHQSSSSSSSPITWYARPKPTDAKWSVRLVHVNQQALVKDLFAKGKVDVFGKYRNTGQKDPESGMPIVTSEYAVRERSWRNLWNFSPKHFFTDSSGMYWRERRVRPGLYTDGQSVFESSYRYRDGRNGMHKTSSLDALLNSPAIPRKDKDRVLKRLNQDAPDVVLEE